MNKYK